MKRIALLLVLVGCVNRASQSISLYESGDYAGAARSADEGLANHPDDESLWGMKIRAQLALGDGASVVKAYGEYRTKRGEDDKELLRDLVNATLSQALGSPSVKMKMAAVDAVAQLEIHALADQVFVLMEDNDDRVAAAAAIAVLKGFPQAPQVADEMTRSENAEARRIAIDGIGRKVGKLALADLEKAASDKDASVRRVAIRWLGMLKDKDAVELLTRHLKDPDEGVRAASAISLAQIGIGNLAALGKQALGDRMLSVRLAGIELLEAAKRDADLVALTDDPDPLVATAAAIAVKKTQPDLAGKAINRAITAPEWTTRAGAANMMVHAVGKQGARQLALKLVSDPEVGVRLAAARVLVYSGDREAARRVFAAELAHPEFGVQAAADLAAMDDEAGVRALSTFVHDKQYSSEQRARAAMAHHSAHRVTPGLVAALADRDGLVRVQAAAVLGALAK